MNPRWSYDARIGRLNKSFPYPLYTKHLWIIISKEKIFDPETNKDPLEFDGYNQALQDLKSRIPQLTERIVENVIKENDRAGDFHPDCVVIPLYKLKDTLKEGKE